MTQLDPKTDLVLERVVDVAPELVWKAWTTPEYLKQWFTPAPWKTVGCEIDLRPGRADHLNRRSCPRSSSWCSYRCSSDYLACRSRRRR